MLNAIEWPLDTANMDAFMQYLAAMLPQQEVDHLIDKATMQMAMWNSDNVAMKCEEVALVEPALDRFIQIAQLHAGEQKEPIPTWILQLANGLHRLQQLSCSLRSRLGRGG